MGKNLKIAKDIKSRIFKQQNNINDCMFSNHKKKANQLNERDLDEVVNEPSNKTGVQSNEKDVDFVQIGNNVFLNKKRTKLMKLQMIMILMKIYFKSIFDDLDEVRNTTTIILINNLMNMVYFPRFH